MSGLSNPFEDAQKLARSSAQSIAKLQAEEKRKQEVSNILAGFAEAQKRAPGSRVKQEQASLDTLLVKPLGSILTGGKDGSSK